jgi:hypothetical protein
MQLCIYLVFNGFFVADISFELIKHRFRQVARKENFPERYLFLFSYISINF